MSLSDPEIERYARHIVLPGVGGPGQNALKQARVLIIGAGGLGAPVMQYLVAAGVGHLTVLDDDSVSLSNLQRQILFGTDDVGTPKVYAAARRLNALNPHVTVDPIAERLNHLNALNLIEGHDLVLDGCDNFATRYLTADACHLARRSLISGTVGTFDGYLTVFRSFDRDGEGQPYPTYRCLYPRAPEPGQIPACEEAGILGALTGVVGSLMAMEALKLITRTGTPFLSRQLLYDGRDGRFETVWYRRRPDNPLNGDGDTYKDLSHHGDPKP